MKLQKQPKVPVNTASIGAIITVIVIILLVPIFFFDCGAPLLKVSIKVPTNAKLSFPNIHTLAVIDFLSSEERFDPGKKAAKLLREQLDALPQFSVIGEKETKDAVKAFKDEHQGTVIKQGELFTAVGKKLLVDAIVSGSVNFTSTDASGYERQEFTDPRTGARYYREVWVEKVRLKMEMEVYLVNTFDGTYLFNEKFTNETTLLRENSSTSMYGFFELVEDQVKKFVAKFSSQQRTEVRYLYR